MQRVIIVLGMQRSGTSCLAGILEKAGVNLGNVSKYNLFNKKGNRESKRIMKLHDDLFAYNNGTWDDPPPGVKWPDHLKKERDGIIGEYAPYSTWGFKDPRALLTLDGWLEVLQNVSFAGTFRHPLPVAQSLYRRDKSPYSKSFALWKMYNEMLLYYYEKFNFPVISFDLSGDKYKNRIRKLLTLLALDNGGDAFEFYDNELRHHDNVPGYDIPRDVFEIYEKLNRVAL